MRVVRETDVGDAGDGHQNGRAEQREAARPPAGIPVPALAEDVIQTPHLQEHGDLSAPRYVGPPTPALMVMEVPVSTVKAVGCCQLRLTIWTTRPSPWPPPGTGIP